MYVCPCKCDFVGGNRHSNAIRYGHQNIHSREREAAWREERHEHVHIRT